MALHCVAHTRRYRRASQLVYTAKPLTIIRTLNSLFSCVFRSISSVQFIGQAVDSKQLSTVNMPDAHPKEQ